MLAEIRSISFTFVFSTIVFTSFKPDVNITNGQWICETELYDMEVNDTLNFTKTEYRETLYQWGGALNGVEFRMPGGFSEYHNVLCSSESDPQRFYNETWKQDKDLIRIEGEQREMEWKILGASKQRLMVLVTKIKMKNEQ